VDASLPLNENDDDIIEKIGSRQTIVLLNKSDLTTVTSEEEIKKHLSCPVIAFSAKTGDGADILEQTITEMFFSGSIMDNNEVFLTNARHISAMSHAKGSLLHVIDSIENNMPEDFLTIDLMDAYEQLGYIIGESVEDDLVNEIFAKFCTGK
jgi:tRNA modification GTPase